MKKLIFLLLVILVLLNKGIYSQVTQGWVSRYHNNNINSVGNCILLDKSGNIIVAGTSGNEIRVLKYTTNGVNVWTTSYQHPNNIRLSISLAIDDNNNIYITAMTDNSIDIITIKFNSQGIFQWVSTYSTQGYSQDLSVKVMVGKDGFVYTLGSVSPVQYDFHTAIIKYNSMNGDTLWTKIFDDVTMPSDMVLDNHNNIFVAGYGMKVLKCDKNGKLIWSTSSAGGESHAITLDNKGNIYLTGELYGQASEMDCITVKFDSLGSTKWVKIFNTNHYDCAYSIAVDDSANVFIAGYCTPTSLYSRACLVVKYNTNGTKLWDRNILTPTNNYDSFRKIVVDKFGNCYATGYTCYYGYFDRKLTTVKYSKDGNLIWDIYYLNFSTGSDEANDISLDSSSNIYVTGSSLSSTNFNIDDIVTIKYSQINNISVIGNGIPMKYSLFQNFPNPFNPTTTIKFDIPKLSNVKITVYDITGKELEVLENEKLQAGTYQTTWNASNFSSGVYFYRLIAGDFIETKSMLFIK